MKQNCIIPVGVKKRPYSKLVDLQLALIRIYIGLDFSHHFAEKFGLLGPAAYNSVLHYFSSLGDPASMVLIAGLIECGAFITFTFGLFTRIAGVGVCIYLLTSLFMGYHYEAGFTWADHVSGIMIDSTRQSVYGGWEFPLMWAFLCLTFAITGGRKWSLDAWIRKYNIPVLRLLCK